MRAVMGSDLLARAPYPAKARSGLAAGWLRLRDGQRNRTRSIPERNVRHGGVVALRALVRQRAAFDHVVDGLGDVGRMVAHALDVLGAEQEMDAVADVARVLHH